MSAYWKDGPEVVWVCSRGDEHPQNLRYCRDQNSPEPRPPRQSTLADTPAGEQSTGGFYLILPNGVRVRIEGDLTIGRSLDSVVGLSLLQFADVSRAHLEVRLDEGRFLRFVPVKPSEEAPVYHVPMPAPEVLTVESLAAVRPRLIEKGDERRDELILERGSSESRLFCLGQHCMIRFAWEVE